MVARVDLAGKKFGRLTVVRFAGANERKELLWECVCDCPAQAMTIVSRKLLQQGATRSCGCLVTMRKSDLTGKTFGHLTVLRCVGGRVSAGTMWECMCDCPAKTVKVIRGHSLRHGRTTSCGCHQREALAKARTTHGMSRTRDYYIWHHMLQRCYNSNDNVYQWYGAKGITVCNEWRKSFAAFHKSMGPRPSVGHSIDRIDGTKGYSPENCRWATTAEQNTNQARTQVLEFRDESHSVAEWARRTNLDADAIRKRLKVGWSVEDALTTPLYVRRRNAAAKDNRIASQTPEYRTWHSMNERCHNVNNAQYRNYGGRGIDVCDQWRSRGRRGRWKLGDEFKQFLADVGYRPTPEHSLDRIDNDLGYFPGNCRWATNKQQSRNRRSNRMLEFRGEKITLMELSERFNVRYSTLSNRLRNGWSLEDAVTTPPDVRRPR